ncbi:MAG TPA: cation diffusion facilitator family transporter [Baekduia sp.]|nr:cation diffusion facilitator family transporter [Baekduia sp.]
MGGHAHHSHAPGADADRRWLTVALALTGGFLVAEVVAGLLAGSLALLSDAAHMLTDTASIALALVAARVAARPADARYTFGFGRAEILSAQVNGAALLVLAAVIAVEAVRRLADPPDVDGVVVIAIGVLGAGVNVAAAWALSRAERRSLNVEGARAHVLADLYGSLAAVAGGIVLVTTDRGEADGAAALVVAALMVRSGWSLVRDSGRVLLEAAPRGVDTGEIGRALAGAPGVVEVHDLHVWEVTSGFPALSAHVVVETHADCHRRRAELEHLLHERFSITHTTLQVEHAPGLVQLDEPPPAGR